MEEFEQKVKEKVGELKTGKHGMLRRCIFFLLAGICLLIILWPSKQESAGDATSLFDENDTGQTTDTEQASEATDVSSSKEEYISLLESRLKQMLEKVKGVGNVDVMITLADSGEKIVEKDVTNSESQSDTDSQTSNSETSVMIQTDDSDEPYVSKVLEPEIEGVVVTCTGASDPEIVVQITEAVQALFDVPAHRIVVLEQE